MSLRVSARYEVRAGFEIEGEAEGLLGLARQLSHASGKADDDLIVPTSSPTPHDKFMKCLRVETSSVPTEVSCEGDVLIVRGDAEGLGAISKAIESLASEASPREGLHVHVEYYDGHPFLSQVSEALTAVLRTGANKVIRRTGGRRRADSLAAG